MKMACHVLMEAMTDSFFKEIKNKNITVKNNKIINRRRNHRFRENYLLPYLLFNNYLSSSYL